MDEEFAGFVEKANKFSTGEISASDRCVSFAS